MSDTQFTPGPWSANGSHIYAPDGEILAQVHNPGRCASDYPLVPNRDLMAAAPDLFIALEAIVTGLRATEANDGEKPIWRSAFDALARARGQS